jgi:hypothetical protein
VQLWYQITPTLGGGEQEVEDEAVRPAGSAYQKSPLKLWHQKERI